MHHRPQKFVSVLLLLLFFLLFFGPLSGQDNDKQKKLDKKVEGFLENHRGAWRDMNVPASDGKILHDLIIKNNYKKALEIGTSTGHSGIWMAWALSKTGGKLITIEIDKDRYQEALNNFEKAGLSEFIDARLADAHKLVKELKGPFDFIFSDADKGWYKNYFIDVYPKLEVGGCFTAHNISARSGRGGTRGFYDYIKGLSDMETILDKSGAGISISYKRTIK